MFNIEEKAWCLGTHKAEEQMAVDFLHFLLSIYHFLLEASIS